MKYLLAMMAVLCGLGAGAQNLNGQWRGEFNSAGSIVAGSTGNTEYVLELEIKGATVTGYSYTYFILPEKRCFVLCRLEGKYEKEAKSIVVQEVEKVKSNTPAGFIDCLQTHMLTYLKKGDTEKLVGSWKPARVVDNCGTGSTELERKMLSKIAPPRSTPSIARSAPPNKTNSKTGTVKPPFNPSTSRKPTTSAPLAKNPSVKKPAGPVTKKPTPSLKQSPEKTSTVRQPERKGPDTAIARQPEKLVVEKPVIKKMGSRSKDVLRTIEVVSPDVRIDLYDNGEIDGDTVSLFFNGKLLASKKRLTDKALSFTIEVDSEEEENDLVMYAENLGSIPPNTALMVVTDGESRYEARITSTQQTNGTIRFRRKK